VLTRRGWLTLVGFGGTTLVAVSSWWVGGAPIWFRTNQPSLLSWLPLHSGVAMTAYLAGLALLLGAWLALGRYVLAAAEQIELRRLVAAWAAPMLVSMPMGRDLWVYLAHGWLVQSGFDPYRDSPAVLDSAIRSEVSARWLHMPSPYGPLWIETGRLAGVVTDPHFVVGTFLLRLPVYAALLVLSWLVYVLAGQFGLRGDRAVWLALANPLAIILTVGGHNDLVLAALAVGGVTVAVRRGGTWPDLVAGAALIGLAALIKFPALIALAFVVPIWLTVRGTGRPMGLVVKAGAAAVGGGVASAGLVTALSGLGVGWVRQATADNSIVNWQSLPSLVGMGVNAVRLGVGHATELNDTIRFWRAVGGLAAALIVLVLWYLALRRLRITDCFALLGISFVVVIVFGQTFQPWYLCWALPFLALGVTSALGIGLLVALSLFEMLVTLPDGRGLEDQVWAIPALAVAVLGAWWMLRSVPRDGDADDAGSGVRADRSADLSSDQLPH
jgi:hypothetical protein